MSKRPRVLVLLATYNGEALLERQLQSVLAQRDVDLVIDTRDDGSSDRTREVLLKFTVRDSRVSLRRDHKPSGSAAANFFELIRGADLRFITHVAFCDQDDEWLPEKLSRSIRRLNETSADACSAAVEACWPDGRKQVLIQNPRERRADHLFEGAGQGCTFVFTVELFRLLQCDVIKHATVLSAVHYHDWAMYALTRASGARWSFDSQPVMIYHQHTGNDTGARNSIHGMTRRISMIRNGWYRSQVQAVVDLLRAARPDHEPAVAWSRLALMPGGRLARLIYVVSNGRRRFIDRVILAAAVVFGYV